MEQNNRFYFYKDTHFYVGLLFILIAGGLLGLGISIILLKNVEKEVCGATITGISFALFIDGIILLKNYRRLDIHKKKKEKLELLYGKKENKNKIS